MKSWAEGRLETTTQDKDAPAAKRAAAQWWRRILKDGETKGGQLVVGVFVDAENRVHLMVVNRKYNAPATAKLVFKVPVAEFLKTSKATGRPAPYDGYDIATAILTVDLESGDGRLFRLQ